MARLIAAALLRRGRILSVAVSALMLVVGCLSASTALGVTFDPKKVISDDNFRDYTSMSEAEIQQVLNSAPCLASYEATDLADNKKHLASKIIYDAAQKFQVNPKVVLTMLQKEQSLLTRSKDSLITGKHATLDWAMGMGCPDGYSSCMVSGCHSKTPPDNRYPEYKGFGKQIWAATWNLSAYGQKGAVRPKWHPSAPSGTQTWPSDFKAGSSYVTCGKTKVYPKNLATYKLYIYNPSIGAKTPYGDLSGQSCSGNANFWKIYRKYFGDPLASPRYKQIFRIRNTRTGNYLFTASPAERYRYVRKSGYKVERVAFSIDTSCAANKVAVYRFQNRKNGGWFYTTSSKKRDTLKASTSKWRYQGIAFRVASKTETCTPVYQFVSKKYGLPFFTTSSAEKKLFATKKYRRKWRSRGIAFYLAR